MHEAQHPHLSNHTTAGPPSRASLRESLAARGLFGIGVPRHLGGDGGQLRDVVHAVAEAAQSCVAQALVLASQRLLVQALVRSRNIGAAEYQLPRLLDGDIGGNCAASWPHDGAVAPAHAHDTGRGWRMSGDFPVLPNLQHDWFLVSAPVLFEGAHQFSLVLLRAEETGIAQRHAAVQEHPTEAGIALQLRNVFLREDEIIAEDGPAAVAHLVPFARAMQAAIFAGRCHWAVAKSPDLVGAEVVIEDLLACAVRAAMNASDGAVPLAALRRMWAALSPATNGVSGKAHPTVLAAP
jgi:alkylation response protein AidB-like acyl-CoA dehydrogenase